MSPPNLSSLVGFVLSTPNSEIASDSTHWLTFYDTLPNDSTTVRVAGALFEFLGGIRRSAHRPLTDLKQSRRKRCRYLDSGRGFEDIKEEETGGSWATQILGCEEGEGCGDRKAKA